jgi:hypothetical protein
VSENGRNGHADLTCTEPDLLELTGTNLADDNKKEELMAKLLRHRKILLSNYEQVCKRAIYKRVIFVELLKILCAINLLVILRAMYL